MISAVQLLCGSTNWNWKTVWDVITDILSLFAAFVSAFFAWKAYHIALKIFHKGIKIDQNKVLTQVSLEIVTQFVVPFNRLVNAVNPLWDDFHKPVNVGLKVSTVLDILKQYSFKSGFTYFEANKGFVWDALLDKEIDKAFAEKKQAEAYCNINNFVIDTDAFCEGLKKITDELEKYIDADRVKRSNDTLKDFFNDNYSNEKLFTSGAQSFLSISEEIDNLPIEFDIIRMKDRLSIGDSRKTD